MSAAIFRGALPIRPDGRRTSFRARGVACFGAVGRSRFLAGAGAACFCTVACSTGGCSKTATGFDVVEGARFRAPA